MDDASADHSPVERAREAAPVNSSGIELAEAVCEFARVNHDTCIKKFEDHLRQEDD
jgi:hypothetical protein